MRQSLTKTALFSAVCLLLVVSGSGNAAESGRLAQNAETRSAGEAGEDSGTKDSAAGSDASLRIILRRHVRVNSSRIRLENIAELAGPEASSKEVAKLIIRQWKRDEDRIILKHDLLRRMLTKELSRPFILIGSRVRITRSIHQINAAAFRQAAVAWLKNRSDKWELLSLEEKRCRFPGTAFSLKVFARQVRPGRQSLQFAVMDDTRGEIRRIVALNAVIARRETVLVAARDLRAGEKPGPEDVRSRMRRVLQENADAAQNGSSGRENAAGGEKGNTPDPSRSERDSIRNYKTIKGRRLRRPVAEGAVLRLDSFEKPLLVRRGDTVRLLFEEGGIRIESTARAMESGRQGERIQVRIPGRGSANTSLLRGSVRARNLVIIREGND